jgi:hypothetical protein
MNIDYIIPFIDAFAYVMKHYMKLTVTPGEPFYSSGLGTFPKEAVSCVVALNGKTLDGFIAISFPRELLLDTACYLFSHDAFRQGCLFQCTIASGHPDCTVREDYIGSKAYWTATHAGCFFQPCGQSVKCLSLTIVRPVRVRLSCKFKI